MERLNDIMNRAAQRRQSQPEQRANQGASSQRLPQTPPTTSRRSLQEQSGRLGQQSYNQPLNQHLSSAGPRGGREQGDYPPSNQRAARGYGAGNVRRSPMQRPVTNEAAPYQQTRYPQETQRVPAMPPQPAPNYYTDDYAPPPGDVIDDYDEFEDDDAGMLYMEDGHEELIYLRADADMSAASRPAYPPAAYDRQRSEEGEMRVRATRDLRMSMNTQPPALPGPAAALPPARTQEVQHLRRMTQPLNPQAVVEVSREQDPRYNTRLPQSMQRQVPQRAQSRRYEQAAPSQLTQAVAPRSTCPKCKGAGYLRQDVPFGHPGFGKLVECTCKVAEKREKRRQQLRDMSNMSAFREHTFATFNPRVPGVQEAYQAAREYARNPQGWLLLVGPNGCGKTHLAAAIANQSLENEAVVLFAVVPDLLDHLRAAFAPNAPEVYDQLFAKMREAEVLVLDDLGAQQSSPWANEKLFQLLNYRYNMGMPTVITANQRGLQGIDERIASRLMDVSLVTRINLDRARDYRPHHPGKRSTGY